MFRTDVMSDQISQAGPVNLLQIAGQLGPLIRVEFAPEGQKLLLTMLPHGGSDAVEALRIGAR